MIGDDRNIYDGLGDSWAEDQGDFFGDDERNDVPDVSPEEVLEALSVPTDAPDVTGSVMQRLGYECANAEAAAEERRRFWTMRGVVAAMITLMFIGGYQMYEDSPEIRRVGESTLSGALSNDLHQRQEQLNSLFESIRFDGNALQWEGGATVRPVGDVSPWTTWVEETSENADASMTDDGDAEVTEDREPADIETLDDGSRIPTLAPWSWA